jgi:hypothetical protein
MKRLLISTLCIAVSLSFSSCFLNLSKNNEKPQPLELDQVSVNDDYSIGIPKFMTKATSLNDEASLQYQNLFKETYVIVIDESRQAFIDALVAAEIYDSTKSVIDSYTDTQIQFTTSAMKVLSKSEVKKVMINGLSAETTELDGELEGVRAPITYFLTCVDGPDKLYMIMAWTLKDRKDDHRETFRQIAESFKVLKDAPVAAN